MGIDSLHRLVAQVVLDAAAGHGFALAGGNALLAHQLGNRPTQDVDLFTNRADGVEAAIGGVEGALRAAGFRTDRVDRTAGLTDVFGSEMGAGLAEWIVIAADGRRMTLQMAYFDRGREPVVMEIGPVLDLEDVLGGKTNALASRVEPRDYVDIATALERYRPAQLIGFGKRIDAGLRDEDYADAGRRLDQLSDRRFTAFGLGFRDIDRVRERFAAWPRTAAEAARQQAAERQYEIAGQQRQAERNMEADREFEIGS
jgi:Nucleotidyl transferase AbiEii toxin, Type IV TA system